MFDLGKLIGKKVVAIKGLRFKDAKDELVDDFVKPMYILFDDGETYIDLEECEECDSSCASYVRSLDVIVNNDMWVLLMEKYENADIDL